jgi:hypothetical protein
MPDSGENIPKEEKFLSAEYQALVGIDGSRNDRLDRFVTIFISMAAAPWALYALTVKEHAEIPSFGALPMPVSASLVLIAILGALVTMMYIQMRLTIILYTRALNAIRGYFLDKDTTLTFRLPTDPTKPPYYEKGNYTQFAVAGMGLVNATYLGLGLYNLVLWPCDSLARTAVFAVVGALVWYGHLNYYSQQANKREKASKGKHELHWDHGKHA